jgi:hypothetical protein
MRDLPPGRNFFRQSSTIAGNSQVLSGNHEPCRNHSYVALSPS